MSEKPVNVGRKKKEQKNREPAHSQLSSFFFIALVEFYFPFPNFSLFAADLFQALLPYSGLFPCVRGDQ